MGQGSVAKALAKRVVDVDEVVDLGVSVELSGATGPQAGSINGVYEPTPELMQGQVVYAKKALGPVTGPVTGSGGGGGAEMCLFYTRQGIWVVSASGARAAIARSQGAIAGMSNVMAHVVCEAGTRPEQCTGVWRGGKEEQASMRAAGVGESVVGLSINLVFLNFA